MTTQHIKICRILLKKQLAEHLELNAQIRKG